MTFVKKKKVDTNRLGKVMGITPPTKAVSSLNKNIFSVAKLELYQITIQIKKLNVLISLAIMFYNHDIVWDNVAPTCIHCTDYHLKSFS